MFLILFQGPLAGGPPPPPPPPPPVETHGGGWVPTRRMLRQREWEWEPRKKRRNDDLEVLEILIADD